MKKIIITESNRDGAKVWLEHFKGDDWIIHSDKDFILNFASINYDELPVNSTEYDECYTDQFGREHKCKIYSFDPSGGPYLSINTKLEDKTITRISNNGSNYIFTLL